MSSIEENTKIDTKFCGDGGDVDIKLLVGKAKAGDRIAFNAIFTLYKQRIFAISIRYLHNEQDAADIVQETFLNALKFLYKFNEKSDISTWLVRICLNLCWQKRKHIAEKNKFEVSLDINYENEEGDCVKQVVSGEAQPHDILEQQQESRRIRDILDSLKKKYRELIILKELEGYSYEECARILDISEGTVMSRLHRARKILIKKLSG